MVVKTLVVSTVCAVVCIAVISLTLSGGGSDTTAVEYPDAPEVGEPDIVISSNADADAFFSATLDDSMDDIVVALAGNVTATVAGGTFAGTLDGGGHTLTLNIQTADSDGFSYLFFETDNATIYNVVIAGGVGTSDSIISAVVWRMSSTLVYNVALDVTTASASGIEVCLAAFAYGSTLVYVSGGETLVYVSGASMYYGCDDCYITTRGEMFGDESDWNQVIG